MSAEENAKQIGELQARVSELEGRMIFVMGVIPALQETILHLQTTLIKQIEARIDAPADADRRT